LRWIGLVLGLALVAGMLQVPEKTEAMPVEKPTEKFERPDEAGALVTAKVT
jgi:hypothetical protein